MSASRDRDEGPIYYREIQKNTYLKRIPNETGGSKLRPLGHKRIVLKPMWTVLCVHNGRLPYLEQYPEAEGSATAAHRPAWRASLRTARHVTASVKPHTGEEYDFLVDTDEGPVRMLAADWDSMQDWVSTLRSKLQELKILSGGENVYAAPPAAPPPRAPARDPTSPLPPTPPVPPDRVPGIELTIPASRQIQQTQPPPTVPEPTPNRTETISRQAQNTEPSQSTVSSEDIDISNWDSPFSSLPSTSHDTRSEPRRSVAKICGQNICLDDSILKRETNAENTSDEEFFAEIDRIHGSISNLDLTEADPPAEVNVSTGEVNVTSETKQEVNTNFAVKVNSAGVNVSTSSEVKDYRQTVVVGNEGEGSGTRDHDDLHNDDYQGTNVTVIQVSNKGPPHTAIPVLGPETNVFNFDFKQNVSVNLESERKNYINIVHTEANTNQNGYGTVFSNNDYGHISLTTTVNLPEATRNEAVYEKLCLASTSQQNASPLPVRKLLASEKLRKSSLPNLDSNSESTYECLFPNSNTSQARSVTVNNDVQNVARPPQNGQNSSAIATSQSPRPMNVHVNLCSMVSVGSNMDSSARSGRSNIERSHSQNSYDGPPRLRESLLRRVHNSSPKRDEKTDKTESHQAKPIWKRGLTEFSLLSRFRGAGGKRRDSPPRQDDAHRSATSPVRVVRRSRPEARPDTARRRSNSLSNGVSLAGGGGGGAGPGGGGAGVPPALQSLWQRQAAALRGEQARGAALPAALPARDPPLFCDYNKQLWVAWWGYSGARCAGRGGDRVAALGGAAAADAAHARQLLKGTHKHLVNILFHRVPLAKVYVLNKRDHESIGIKLDGECCIVSVAAGGPAARAGLPPPGKWALTEVNNKPINLLKGGEEEMNRLSQRGTEVFILIQPAALVKKMRAAIKANRPLLSIR